jgi:carbonic anhydrase/acetyltransferase-like protein (isoleucine patch superfamily)
VHPSVFVAPTASIIGDVEVGEGSSVWYGAVLRGDESAIRIGSHTNIQDNAVLHCSEDLPTIVGSSVTVGHSALLEGCVVEDGALVGMGAILLQRSRLGEGAILGAGSVLREGTEIPAGMLAAGTPAQVKKPVAPDGRWSGGRPVRTYRDLAEAHATSLVEIER